MAASPDMASEASARKLTYDDFVNFPDDGLRHELIDGVHYVTPSPIAKHQRVSVRLSGDLYAYLKVNPIGEVFHAPFDVVISHVDVVEPDLLVVLADQSDIVTVKHVRGTPAIVAEILSPGTRRVDETVKRGLYERSGVREYWVVDPERDTVTVHRRSADGTLTAAPELTRGGSDVLTSPLLPGWSMPIATLFA
jgi:Uma2 family endonuclease